MPVPAPIALPITTASPIQAALPPDNRQPLRWGQLYGAAPALLIAAATRFRGLILVIAPDSQTALRLETELRVLGGAELEILAFPTGRRCPTMDFRRIRTSSRNG